MTIQPINPKKVPYFEPDKVRCMRCANVFLHFQTRDGYCIDCLAIDRRELAAKLHRLEDLYEKCI